ncbi:MAG: ABC transporter ATP-binding protein/permease [Chloroflexota bacterium]|nr:ABC transporter ATP-binding protein/permease [Chloroflexota bacterium]
MAPAGGGRALGRALLFLCSYRKETFGALLALLVTSASILAAPQLIRVAVDVGLAERQLDMLFLAVGGLVAVVAVRGLFTFLQGYLAERASQGVAYDLRDALFVKIERLSFSYYDRVQTGQLLTRLTSDVEQIRAFTGSGVVQLVAAIVMLVGSAAPLFAMNWRLALVSLLIFPLILLLLTRFVRRIAPLFGQIQGTLGRLNTILQEDLAGLRVIRAFGREEHELARYRAVNDELLDHNQTAIGLFSANFPLVFLLSNLGTLAVVWYGGLEIFAGRLTVGELLAFNAYLSFMLFPVLTIGFLAAGISRAAASAARVYEIIDAPLDVQDRPGAVPLPPVRGRVRFVDVHFRYSGDVGEVLRGVSFVVEPGQTVAILGATGSGKSTLVNLIPRFYDVTAGRVEIDGNDVRDVTLVSLRSQVGIVLQDALLFSGTVRDNIAYGRPDATLDEIVAAARAAQADEFIRDLPAGYDTLIGERGDSSPPGTRPRPDVGRRRELAA